MSDSTPRRDSTSNLADALAEVRRNLANRPMDPKHRQVWKFPLGPYNLIVLPPMTDPKVVLVGMNPAVPAEVTVWVEHVPDPEPTVASRTRSLTFMIIGTGRPIPHGATHVGSVIRDDKVWHVYEAGS